MEKIVGKRYCKRNDPLYYAFVVFAYNIGSLCPEYLHLKYNSIEF